MKLSYGRTIRSVEIVERPPHLPADPRTFRELHPQSWALAFPDGQMPCQCPLNIDAMKLLSTSFPCRGCALPFNRGEFDTCGPFGGGNTNNAHMMRAMVADMVRSLHSPQGQWSRRENDPIPDLAIFAQKLPGLPQDLGQAQNPTQTARHRICNRPGQGQ